MLRRISKDDFKNILDGLAHETTEIKNSVENSLGKALEQAHNYSKYPLTDIAVDESTNTLFVDVALAGFTKDNIDISIEDNWLTISATMDKDIQEGIRFIQQHIARRDVVRKIELNPRYNNGKIQASFEDGMLSLVIEPVQKASTKIKIS